MTRPMIRFLTTIGIATALAMVFPMASHATELEPDRIGWSALKFRATKFLFTVNAGVSIEASNPETVGALLIVPGEGEAVQPQCGQQILTLSMEAFGRVSQTELILNAGNGAALQRTSHDSGSRYRHRIYRYTDRGAYQKTRWPAGKGEEKLPVDQWPQWSNANEDLRPYPAVVFDTLITEPTGLLYIVGAAPLDEPGDTFEILAYVRKHVHRVYVEVVGTETIKLKYRVHDGSKSEKREGKQPAIRMLLRGEGVDDGDSDDEFELLGLRGDIVLHLDPATRAPLQLEGRVKIAGKTKMQLVELTTNAPGPDDQSGQHR